ncbi:hypothetical protein [Candidatus Tokpelaia sp.]|uniref:hypothetical protein n=1 Tax=Candidatus Tokpelaia sp. TaxID=2233777 RepID=UPI001239CA3E|nr:hypothetical protein [Candidatus Tokpelaia sp.]KAA6405751.1 hypothetical protein DPQ22_03125 [Candidatus Tokpelaia sp.]
MANPLKDYEILTDALYVAGRRNPGKGKFIQLSTAEAQYPLMLGHIAVAKSKRPSLPARTAQE